MSSIPNRGHSRQAQSSLESLESMTGYGEASSALSGVSMFCRVKSLNHRFLDVKIRLPRPDLQALELAARKLVGEYFVRGSIELTLGVETKKDSTEAALNTKLAKAYWSSAEKLSKELKIKNGLTLDGLLKLPGVLSVGSSSEIEFSEIDEKKILSRIIEPALKALKKTRLAEGRKLSDHFDQLLDQMDEEFSSIRALEPTEKERARGVLTERAQETLKLLNSIGETGHSGQDFSQRLREEAVFWIERRDFEEERVRLEMHLKTFRDHLKAPEPQIGRKLEFLHQELLREVNTLGNKAQSTPISKHTVELKVILEKIREQLANVC